MEKLTEQGISVTNITHTVTQITDQVNKLDQNDYIIYSTLVKNNIGLDQINDTVLEIAEDTLKLLKGISICASVNSTK